jgi:hypothetical protein
VLTKEKELAALRKKLEQVKFEEADVMDVEGRKG